METDRFAIVHSALRNKDAAYGVAGQGLQQARHDGDPHAVAAGGDSRSRFPVLDEEVEIKPAELKMASQVVELMTED